MILENNLFYFKKEIFKKKKNKFVKYIIIMIIKKIKNELLSMLLNIPVIRSFIIYSIYTDLK
jgi:hypothetical protein